MENIILIILIINDDEDYAVKKNDNNKNKDKNNIDYREIYVLREDEIELLNIPENYIKNTLLGIIIKEL